MLKKGKPSRQDSLEANKVRPATNEEHPLDNRTAQAETTKTERRQGQENQEQHKASRKTPSSEGADAR